MNMNKPIQRILAAALSLALILSGTPMTAITVYAQEGEGCTHVHDEACGYAEGADCDHSHDESCGEDGVDCAHDCGDGTCAYIAAAPCTHEHDEACGGLLVDDTEPGEGDDPVTSTDAVVLGFSTPTQTASVRLGTSYGELPLPETLAAELDGESEPADVPVSWMEVDSYDGDTPGHYGFTGQMGAGYLLADGVSAPGFTITVDVDTATPTQIIVARFDELGEDMATQGYDPGEIASVDELNLPATLTGANAEDEALTIEGVTWKCTAIVSDPEADPIAFDPNTTNIYEFTAVLPEGYVLAEDVSLPVITVIIRGDIMTMAAGSDLTISGGSGYTYALDSTTNTYVLTITQNGSYTIGMANAGATTTTDCIAVQSGLTGVNITLNGVSIDMSGREDVCAFDMNGAAVNLTLTGSNTLKSGLGRAGLEVTRNESTHTCTLTITDASTGSLTAVGGGNGTGIGSGRFTYPYDCGTITIAGGTVNAYGGTQSAGIGDSFPRPGYGVVTITGGRVTATGGQLAAGIGGGANVLDGGYGCTVNIFGGTVITSGGSNKAPGIGSGVGGNSPSTGTLTITGGSVLRNSGTSGGSAHEATATNGGGTELKAIRLTLGALRAETQVTALNIGGYGINDVYTDNGGNIYLHLPASTGTNIKVTAGSIVYSNTASPGTEDSKILKEPVQNTGHTITLQTATDRLDVSMVADLFTIAPNSGFARYTLDGMSGGGAGSLSGRTLTITNPGTFTIGLTTDETTTAHAGAKVTATLVVNNVIAGNVDLSVATIEQFSYVGGVLTLSNSGDYAISMAPGKTSTAHRIEVTNNAVVNITLDGVSTEGLAAYQSALDIQAGATANITLINQNSFSGGPNAAGLHVPTGATLCITDGSTGSLDVTGSSSSAGIGGASGESAGSITIGGGTVTATASRNGAGIGGGNGGSGGVINITGGIVTATGNYGAGIGGGNSAGGTITISGGVVTAIGSMSGAGIGGGGYQGDGGTIKITGGYVTATGGTNSSAGIGGGNTGNGGNITISGGTVTATAGGSAAGIGGGLGASDKGTLTITGGSIRRSGSASWEAIATDGSANVYLTTLTVGNPIVADAAITAGAINNVACSTSTPSGGAYGINDVVTDTDGKLYFWLPTATNISVSMTADDTQYKNDTVNITTNNAAAATLLLVKKMQSPPAVPTLAEKTESTVTLVAIPDAKYARNTTNAAPSIPGIYWQESPEFTGLSTNTNYYFFAYYPETGTHNASAASVGLAVTTDKAAQSAPTDPPEFDSKTASSVTVKAPSSITEAVEFSLDGTTWQASGAFSGLEANTEYSFTMRYAETATHSASPASPDLAVTTNKAALTGSVSITGTAKYDETLTADTSGLASTPVVSNMGTLAYQWKNSDGDTVLGTGATYTVQADDIGKTITVTVVAANCDGSKESVATSAVAKADQTAPAAPSEASKTDTSITLTAITGAEYRRGDQANGWQDLPIFTGLTANTDYTFYARLKATTTYNASPESPESATITTLKTSQTAPIAPELDSKDAVSVTLQKPSSISGAVEYRQGTGGAWQTSAVFSGLNPNTAYSFYMRLAETGTHEASPASPALAVTTDKAALEGTPTIDIISPKFGDTLTAQTSGLAANPAGNMGALSYQWNRGGTAIIGATQSTYTVAEADLGKTITVTVTAANCSGSRTSAATSVVVKADQAAPTAPTEANKTDVSITLTAITGAEYRRGDQANGWQDTPIFTGLAANTGYTFYARLKATTTHNASPESPESATITTLKTSQTAPIAPELGSKDAVSVTLQKPASVSGTVEYRQGLAGLWQTSATFSGLEPNTAYSFYMRLAETGTHEASPASPALAVTTDKAALEGTPTIDIISPKFGDTLTVQTSGLAANPAGNMGALSYQWNRGGTAIIGATQSTYTVEEADLGKTITVTVTAANCSGSQTSAATSAVVKADGPAAPAVTGSYTGNGTTFTYTVNEIPGAEYSKDGTSWQDSNVFTGFTISSPVTTFYARIKETTTHEAGAVGDTNAVTFIKLNDRTAPSLNYTISGDRATITIAAVTGAEYSFDGGSTWGTTNSKGGYAGTETVSIQIRLAANDTHNQSPANSVIVDLNKQDQAAPPAFTMTYAYNSGTSNFTVTIPAVTNGEYSFDGLTYSATNTTTANPGSFVTGYVRYAETSTHNASPAATSSLTLPVPVTSITVTGTGGADSITANGGTLQMLADVQPAGATQTVTWSVSGGGANISGSGLLTATANGTVTVRATATDGSGVYGEKSITITGQTPPNVPVTSVFVSSSGNTISTKGGAMQMSVSILPSNATNKSVTWSISSGSGASISSSGLLTATANGTVTVRATANDGSGIYGEKTVTISGQSGGSTNPTNPTNPGGSDNSDDNGGGTTTPVTPPAKAPAIPTGDTATLTGKPDANGQLSVTITEQMVKDAIARAEASAKRTGRTSQGISLTFTSSATGVKSLSIQLDAAAIDQMKAAGVKFVSIGSGILRIRFDQAAISQLDAQTIGKVTITAKPADTLSNAAKALIGSRPVFDIIIKDSKGKNITSFGKGVVTISIRYTLGKDEKAGGVYAVYIPATGQPQTLRSGFADGWLVFSRSSLSVYGVGYKAPEKAFTDTTNHHAKDAIDYVVSRGLMAGTSDTAFSPGSAITCNTLAKALNELAGKTVISTLATDKNLTREGMAVMLRQYAKSTGYTLPVSREALTFSDQSSISATNRDAVTALQQAGVLSAKSGTRFSPQATATRAEAAAALHRYIRLTIDESTARGWTRLDDGKWQYYTWDGKLAKGWATIGGGRYYFDQNGVRQTGWRTEANGSRYYLDPATGAMQSGKWVQIGAKWYYFKTDGTLATNTTIDGYEVGADGARKEK